MEPEALGSAGLHRLFLLVVCDSRRERLRNRVVILYGEFDEASGRPDGGLAEGGVTHTEHTKLSGEPIQIQAHAVEICV